MSSALLALAKGARTGEGNLLELAIQAVRVRATVGEISNALESVFGRYSASRTSVRGVYGAAFAADPAWMTLQKEVDQFVAEKGRRPRMLIAKVGQDGHDRGFKIIASGFTDLGFDVVTGPLFQTPEEVALRAIENGVHVLGISSLAGGHKTLVPQVIKALRAHGAGHIVVVAGGVIPTQDESLLNAAGVAAVFGPGTRITDAAKIILNLISAVPQKDIFSKQQKIHPVPQQSNLLIKHRTSPILL